MERFRMKEQIGQGAYSVVIRATDCLTQAEVAIKKINHTAPQIKMVVQREILILQKLQHPNIIRLLHILRDSTYTYLVFEFMPCDLITFYKDTRKNRRRSLTDDEITFISYQVIKGLSYMHRMGIMHRDIKPENILVNPITLEAKLIDFGFACHYRSREAHTQYMVTRWYRPLELVLGLPYDMKIDVFSIGALMMELYNSEEIFRSASNIDQMYWIIQVCGFPSWAPALQKMAQLGLTNRFQTEPTIYAMTSQLRPQAANLIIGMLQSGPQTRLTIEEALAHSYFSRFQKQDKMMTPYTTATLNSQASLSRLSKVSGFTQVPPLALGDLQNTERRQKINGNSSIYLHTGDVNNYISMETERLPINTYQYSSQPNFMQNRRFSYSSQDNKSQIRMYPRMETERAPIRDVRMNTICSGVPPQMQFSTYSPLNSHPIGIIPHTSSAKTFRPPKQRSKGQFGMKLVSIRQEDPQSRGLKYTQTDRQRQSQTREEANNYYLGDRRAGLQLKKDPAFSKIRGKLAPKKLGPNKIKISLSGAQQKYAALSSRN